MKFLSSRVQNVQPSKAVAQEPLGTRGHVPLHFGKWIRTGAQRGHHLKQVTHQGNTSWSSLALDKVAAGASHISHGWT